MNYFYICDLLGGQLDGLREAHNFAVAHGYGEAVVGGV